MSAHQLIPAQLHAHRDELFRLNLEYISWVFEGMESYFGVRMRDVMPGSTEDYVAGALDKVCSESPPVGVFYLLSVNGDHVGMGGLRQVRPGLAEVKRIYVQPTHRGQGLGELMLERLLADAKAFGYQEVCLESAPFMHAAHRRYLNVGFQDCAPYLEAEVPELFHARWRFMRRTL